MRQERFKMEREGLVEEGQEVEISERSPSTGRYTYLVEPSVAMSGIYRTNERIKGRKGRNARIEHTRNGFYLVGEVEGEKEEFSMERKIPTLGREELEEFRQRTKDFYEGKITKNDYKGYSGRYGSYAQKGGKCSMIRLRMAGGRLTK